MNKARIFSIITMLVAVLLIGTGYSMTFINEYVVDAEETASYASLIKNSYPSYLADLEQISYEIKGLKALYIRYYSDIKNNYVKSINELSSIEKNIKEMEQTTNVLAYECKVRNYNDYDIDNKCSTISYNYETVINAFISVVNKYNKRIGEYNNWTINNDHLQEYKLMYYQNYVDVDRNGSFSGMIE